MKLARIGGERKGGFWGKVRGSESRKRGKEGILVRIDVEGTEALTKLLFTIFYSCLLSFTFLCFPPSPFSFTLLFYLIMLSAFFLSK